MRTTLYLMVGYPGSGKTTTARIIHELTGAIHIWADEERQKMFGRPTHTPAESKLLYDTLNLKTEKLLRAGDSVIFDTNFSFHRDRDRLRDIATKANADTKIIWVTTDRETACRRATKESDGQPTRIFGNMSPKDFNRMADNLEPPSADEQAVVVLGINLTTESIARVIKP